MKLSSAWTATISLGLGLLLASPATAQTSSTPSLTSVILTQAYTSTTTIVLPAWPSTWPSDTTTTTAPATVSGYNGTATPSVVPTAGAEAQGGVDRSAAGLAAICMLGVALM